MRGFGIFVGTALIGLAATPLTAAEKTDTEAMPTSQEKARSGWFTWWGSKDNGKPSAPEQEKSQKAKKLEAAGKGTVEDEAALRAREEAAYFRRIEVCDQLYKIAQRVQDDALMRKAEQLHERVWSTYLQRTARLPASKPSQNTDEKILEKHLGPRAEAPRRKRSSVVHSVAEDQPLTADGEEKP